VRQIPSDQPVAGNVPAAGFHMFMKFKGIPKIPTMKSLRQVCSEGLEMGISRLMVKIDDSHRERVDD
jgi:hypothetical protein